MSNTSEEAASSLLDTLIIEDTDEFDEPQSRPNHKRSQTSFRDSVKRERVTPTGRPSRAKEPPIRKDEFVEPLTEMYTMLGAVITPFDSTCGPIVIESAPQCAESLNDLAAKNDSVRRALRTLTQASTMGAVIMAHAPILLIAMQHHMPGALPKLPKPVDESVSDNGDTAA